MSNISPLDAVIRRIKSPQDVSQNEECVIINDKDGTVYNETPQMYERVFKRIHYYAVSNVNKADCAGFPYTINNALTLNVKYSVSCPNDNETRVVKSLYQGKNNLEDYLNGILRSGLAAFYKENSTDNIIANRSNIENYLAEYGHNQTGLAFDTTVKFRNEDRLSNFSLVTTPFEVRVKDYDKALYLKLETDLAVEPEQLELALKSYTKLTSIESEIKKCVENYLLHHVSLTDFCLNLMDGVKAKLFDEINKVVKKEGRNLRFLTLSSTSINNLLPDEDPVRIVKGEDYEIKEYSETVTVESKLNLYLKDLGLYEANKIIDLEEEFGRTVKKVVAKELFGHTYKDILIKVEEIKTTIEEKIQKKAEKIGYRVEQHTFLPQLNQLNILREGFKVDFVEEFNTKDNRVPVRLQVICKGNIGTLGDLDETLLLPGVKMKRKIKEKIKEAVEFSVHKISPEDMFTLFDYSGDADIKSPVQVMKMAISETLKKHFKVDDTTLSMIVKFSDNKVIEKADTLQKGIYTFNLKIIPSANNSRIEPLEVIIRFKVLGVKQDGWSTFQARINRTAEEEIKEIKRILMDYIRRDLRALDYATLTDTSFKSQKTIRNIIETHAFAEAGEQFGLRLQSASPPEIKSKALEEAAETTVHNNRLAEENVRTTKEKLLIADAKELDTLLEERLKASRDVLDLDASEIEEKIEEKLSKNSLHQADAQLSLNSSKGTSSGSSSFDQFDLPKELSDGSNKKDNEQQKTDKNDNG